MSNCVLALTGAEGFLGHHLRARLAAAGRFSARALGRAEMNDPVVLEQAVSGAQAVIHLAGVNRGTDEAIESGNVYLADQLVNALKVTESCPLLVFANSVHTGTDTAYGRGKQRSSDVLRQWAESVGAPYIEVIFPNLFGEWGRPDYHSFVATFCHRLAHGSEPVIEIDRPLDLLHAQDAAQVLIEQLDREASAIVRPHGVPTSVGEVRDQLAWLADTYASGTIPDLTDPFALRLFNTYRSYLYPHGFPILLGSHIDARGSFLEAAKSLGGQSQCSFSHTKPGVTRGQHFHLHKVERFVVLRGHARIAIRPLFSAEKWTFEVSGDEPVVVDMPTLSCHNLENVGNHELSTLFWVNEVFDPSDPDTFFGAV